MEEARHAAIEDLPICLEDLPICLVTMIYRTAGPRAAVALSRTSKAMQAALTDDVWEDFGDRLWSSRPFQNACIAPHKRVAGAKRPGATAAAGGHKAAYRMSLADALTEYDLTNQPWYHTWSGLDFGQTPARYKIARAEKQRSVSTRPVIRTVSFNIDGSMSWDGVQQPGSTWSFVQRGLFETTRPGSVLQYKHTEPLQTPRRVVFPALRVYRVLRRGQWGWVLRSGLDTFTSFKRGGDASDHYDYEEEDEPCIPTLMWRIADLRRQVPGADRAPYSQDIKDNGWLFAEADAFVTDYRRVLRGEPATLGFGDVHGNQFARGP
jgi:hypothetical protein